MNSSSFAPEDHAEKYDELVCEMKEKCKRFGLLIGALIANPENESVSKEAELLRDEAMSLSHKLCSFFRQRAFIVRSPTVFLCHKGEQKDYYRPMQKELERLPRVSVFLDNWSLLPGQDQSTRRIIESALSCSVAVVVASQECLTNVEPLFELFIFCARLKRKHAGGLRDGDPDKRFWIMPDFFSPTLKEKWVDVVISLPLPKVFVDICGAKHEQHYAAEHVEDVTEKVKALLIRKTVIEHREGKKLKPAEFYSSTNAIHRLGFKLFKAFGGSTDEQKEFCIMHLFEEAGKFDTAIKAGTNAFAESVAHAIINRGSEVTDEMRLAFFEENRKNCLQVLEIWLDQNAK